MTDLAAIVGALRPVLAPTPVSAPTGEAAFDDNDALNVLEQWVKEQTELAIGGYTNSCALTLPLDVARLEQQLNLPAGAVSRLLPDVLVRAGWEIQRRGARTWQIVPSKRLSLRIETGM